MSDKAVSLAAQMDMVQDAISDVTSRLPDAFAKDVFPDHAIVEMDGAFWRVGYSVALTENGDKIIIADFDTWEKVEREWQPTKSTQVSIKAITDDTVTVAGYGVVFGGVDLEGETFTATTDYMLDLVPQKLVMYDHAQGQVRNVIGNTAKVASDEFGLFVEAELDRHAEYVEQIRELVEKGALGWSSGSVGHLTERQGKNIKRWPVVEFSLTPTPAEPRTLGVEVIKHLAETNKTFEALLPEDARTASVQDASVENVDGKRLTLEVELLELEATR
jgi:phage head maturation protease